MEFTNTVQSGANLDQGVQVLIIFTRIHQFLVCNHLLPNNGNHNVKEVLNLLVIC